MGNNYTSGSIGGTMLKTAVSMLPGTLAISGYNIADTYFVSQLGTNPLAAMGFTFPVIMLVNCIYRGLGVGVMTTVAHSLGGKKHRKAAGITSSGLMMIIISAICLGCLGLSCIDWTFRQFGATPEIMPLIHDFMGIWYLGSLTIALGMTGNDLLIVAGTPKLASAMMLLGMGLNVCLDPIFIFDRFYGIPGFAMGIRGAALATVLTQVIAAAGVLLILHFKHKLIRFDILKPELLLKTWRLVLRFALPATVGMLLMPIGNGIITWIVSNFGNAAVAGVAAAGRLEMVAFIFPMALGIAIIPMVGQNYGAKQFTRIDSCRRFSMRFAFFFELGMAVIFFILAPVLSSFFTDDPAVKEVMIAYLRIIPAAFGLTEIHRYGGFFFTGCNRPSVAAWLNALRILCLLVPLSLLALHFHSLNGLFAARLVSDIIAGGTAFCAATFLTHKLRRENDLILKNSKKAPESSPNPA